MILFSATALAFLGAVRAVQPSAPKPVAAPLRDLPLGQLNFLHTTDTHGWHAGHLQEPSFSADWGDYHSFAQRMREKIEGEGNDLLIVDTGDRVEGNGLYDASDPQGNYTRKIFQQQHIDIICLGNHELYVGNTSANEYFELVPAYKQNYLASNVDFIDPRDEKRVPFAQRYRKFTTKKHGIRVLAFGFLFDFTGNDKNTIVQPVEETIKEQWFQDAIHDRDVDLFVVAGHVALPQSEFQNIFEAIRAVQWDAPIIFFGGHLHVRDYKRFDEKAYALASGRYLETIGFQSISGLPSHKEKEETMSVQLARPDFARRYIDNNLFSFYHHTSLNETRFPTARGRNISSMIAEARKNLGLDKRYGCAPQDYWMTRTPYPSNNSIFTWLDSQVVPSMVVEPDRADKPRIIIGNTGAMRFDIFKGPFTRDTTYIVSPFTSGFRYIPNIPFRIADRLLEVLNKAGDFLDVPTSTSELAAAQLAPPETVAHASERALPAPDPDFQFLLPDSPAQYPLSPLSYSDKNPPLTPGYTTTDDAGSDGDDTIHSPIKFYDVPPCFETRVNVDEGAKPEDTVDVVYLEFIQPWVLAALRFLGGEYEEGDTGAYLGEKSFTQMIREWVEGNWEGDC